MHADADMALEAIAAYTAGLTYEALPGKTIQEAKRRIADSVACIAGAVEAPPAVIARRIARSMTVLGGATVVGSRERAPVDVASFANSVMVRYLDFNDQYYTPGGGGQHPSDIVPAVMAVGEVCHAAGPDVLLGLVAGYEVGAALAGTCRIRERGWDMGSFLVVAAAMAAGKLLGLSEQQLRHAAAMSVTTNLSSRQTRVGQLSMWKGCATAASVRAGVFCALLAGEGMTGPAHPFSGKDGIMDLITGRFSFDSNKHHRMCLPQDGPFAIEVSNLKKYPCEYNAQGAVEAMISLRKDADVEAEAVEAIEVETYSVSQTEIGGEAEKWRPLTRETADHSLPFLIACALLDGAITVGSFSGDKLADEGIQSLMQRTKVVERREYSERFPEELNVDLHVRLKNGRVLQAHNTHPRGHARNPMSDEEIEEKLEAMSNGRHDAATVREAVRSLWDLEKVADAGTIVRPLAYLGGM